MGSTGIFRFKLTKTENGCELYNSKTGELYKGECREKLICEIGKKIKYDKVHRRKYMVVFNCNVQE